MTTPRSCPLCGESTHVLDASSCWVEPRPDVCDRLRLAAAARMLLEALDAAGSPYAQTQRLQLRAILGEIARPPEARPSTLQRVAEALGLEPEQAAAIPEDDVVIAVAGLVEQLGLVSHSAREAVLALGGWDEQPAGARAQVADLRDLVLPEEVRGAG